MTLEETTNELRKAIAEIIGLGDCEWWKVYVRISEDSSVFGVRISELTLPGETYRESDPESFSVLFAAERYLLTELQGENTKENVANLRTALKR